MTPSKITAVVEKTATGYSAYVAAEGAYATGATLDELKHRLLEACNVQFAAVGQVVSEADLQLVLDLPQFFEYYKIINATALASRIGMSQSLLSQYINGLKTPSRKQTDRILAGVRAVGRELATLDFA